ncbi:MAG: hypothetical protein AABZ34_14800 [Nitrospirota bacterium]
MQIVFIILLWLLTASCVTTVPSPRVIRESGEILVRLDQAKTCELVNQGTPLSHPVRFTGEEVRALIAALSAREKVGLLSSFAATPETPRLFNNHDLELLGPSVQDALAKATPEEVVVFLLVKPARESLSLITSGALSIQNDTLSVALSNFKHPVRTNLSEVGAIDRLSDVRETLRYVRTSPCASVGEQDFALFFDTPHLLTEARSGSLIRYPERTLSIAYPAFLAAHTEAKLERREVESVHSASTHDTGENQVIAELKRRVAELERTNQALTSRTRNSSSESMSDSPKPTSGDSLHSDTDAQVRLIEVIRLLEARVAELERQIGQERGR